jgi:MFS superfamily sulfate permease-like transporter
MLGIGVSNVAAGFFQGFPVSTSGSRTAVAERSGARTQLTGVVGAVLITVMIVAVPGLLRNLPQPALAAVVICASLSLADVPGTVRLWHQRRTEFLLSLAAFLGVALLGVLPGIGIAVLLSILNVFRHAWQPAEAELGRVEGLRGYYELARYPAARRIPGLVVYRFAAPLIFANAKTFRDRVSKLARENPDAQWLLVAAESVTDVDVTAADMLQELNTELEGRGVKLVFAELQDSVREKIEHYELGAALGPGHYYPTVHSAEDAFRAQNGVES